MGAAAPLAGRGVEQQYGLWPEYDRSLSEREPGDTTVPSVFVVLAGGAGMVSMIGDDFAVDLSSDQAVRLAISLTHAAVQARFPSARR